MSIADEGMDRELPGPQPRPMTPATAAGRALLEQFRSRAARTRMDYPVHWLDADDILAIEAEAAAQAAAAPAVSS